MISIVAKNRRLEKIVHRVSPSLARGMKRAYYYFRSRNQAQSIADEIKCDVETVFEKFPQYAMWAKGNGGGLFCHVEIETINRCNQTCSFCPVNRHADPRPLAKMSETTFNKIIDNLVKLDYRGNVSYYSNNEPLVDNRIIDFIKTGVAKLPNANHSLLTNGLLLSAEKFQALIDSGLKYLRIDNYNDDLKLNSNIQDIYNEYKSKEFPLLCEIIISRKNDVLSNRGGSSPNKCKTIEPLSAMCWDPFIQLIIRANSGVSLCCNDALGKITLGNAEEQTLEDIWFSEKRFNILKSLCNSRNNIEVCRGCDIIASKSRRIFNVNPKHLRAININSCKGELNV